MPPSRLLLCATAFALALPAPDAAAQTPPDHRTQAPPSQKPPAPAPQNTPAAAPQKQPAATAATVTPAPTIVEPTEPAPEGQKPAPPVTVPTPPAAPAEREKWLRARIDEILSRPGLAGARVSIAVSDVDSGKVLYAKNDGAQLNPASNVKLFTTAGALALLGPEFRWKTVLLSDGAHAGVIEGNLYLRGFGDPSLRTEDLWKMTSELASHGIKKINGDIIVDDTYFDEQRVGPGFEQKDEDFPFRAPQGAVSLNDNAVSLLVLPGKKEGESARIVLEPTSPYFTILNEVKTVATGRTNLTVATKEAEGHTEVHVGGQIKLGDGGRNDRRRIAHPDLYAGYTLRELLLRRGIKVGGKVATAAAPSSARVIVSHYSQPLGVLVREVNKRSNNFMAEQLLKTIGAETGGKPGSWQKGVDAVGRYLDTIGIPRSRYKMTNGSGLYDSNRFTASQFVTLLRSVYKDFRYAADFVGSLAVAGADGTIGHRLEGGLAERYVRAKTGTLSGVSCLSGYAGGPGHLPIAFAILMNDLSEGSAPDARRAQDAIAETLVTFLGAPQPAAAAAPAPASARPQ